MEELLKKQELLVEICDDGDLLVEHQQQPGPFLLEHFDSSEYSLAVPGEGTRPEVLIMPMRGIFLSLPITFPLKGGVLLD